MTGASGRCGPLVRGGHCPACRQADKLAYSPRGWSLDRAPGLYYSADCQATRAGVGFGASQGRRIFDTEAERDAYVAKRLAESGKRSAKAATSGRSGRKA